MEVICTEQERQLAHAYPDLLPPAQMRAVCGLLETMLDPLVHFEDEEISEEEELAIARSREG